MANSLIKELLQSYGIVAMGAVFFLFSLLTAPTLPRRLLWVFRAITANILLLIFADTGQAWFATYPEPTTARMVCAAAAYSLRVSVLYLFVLIYCREQSRKRKWLLSLVAIVNTLVSFSAFFTDKVFGYTADNVLVRGPLIVIPFAASLLYFVFLLREARRGSHKGEPRELWQMIFVFIVAIVTTLAEVRWALRGVLPACCMFGLYIYYIYFTTEHYCYDQLTGTRLRNSLYKDVRKDKAYGLVTYDLNGLKQINDENGHQAGDKALAAVSSAVRGVLPDNARQYRLGGDEFLVILWDDDLVAVNRLAQAMREAVEATPYRAAIGWTMCKRYESLEKALARADEQMYENKPSTSRKSTADRTDKK